MPFRMVSPLGSVHVGVDNVTTMFLELTFCTLLACKERGVPLPNGAIPISAATDLTGSGETFQTRADADPIIPVDHAAAAHAAIPGSRLEIFEGVGHYPHCEAPERFVEEEAQLLAVAGVHVACACHQTLRTSSVPNRP